MGSLNRLGDKANVAMFFKVQLTNKYSHGFKQYKNIFQLFVAKLMSANLLALGLVYAIFLAISLGVSTPAFAENKSFSKQTKFTYRDEALIEFGGKNVTSQADIFFDKEERYSFEDIKNLRKIWKENTSNILKLDYHPEPIWLRLRLSFGESENSDWYLHLGSGVFRDIEIYVVSEGELIQEHSFKNIKSYSEKVYTHPNFIFPFEAASGEDVEIYVRVHHFSNISMPIYIEDNNSLSLSSQKMIFIYGIFIGLIVVMLIYNSFIYLSTKKIVYLFFVTYVAANGFYFMSINGIGFQFLWQSLPVLDQYMGVIPVAIIVIFSSLLTIEIFDIRKESVALSAYFYFIIFTALVFSLPIFNWEISLVLKLFKFLVTLSLLSFIVVGFYHFKKHRRYAFYYIAAWLSVSFCYLLSWLAVNNIINQDQLYMLSLPIGTIGSAILLSLTLAAKKEMLREEEYQVQANNQARSSFIAKMSHEIRTPMTGILGMSELLADRLKDATDKHYNKVIFQSGQTLLTIVNDILDYSKIESGDMEIKYQRFNLESLVLDTIEIFKTRALDKSLEIIADVDSRIPENVKGDERRVKQVLSSLLANALKYTPEGQIIIKVLLVESDTGVIKISVIDSGDGIDEEYQQVLFEAFSQQASSGRTIIRQSGGVGLGLTICKQLVEMMGGSMGFSSRKGLGSTFWFKIAFEPNDDKFLNHRKFDQIELNGCRVLIVDDNFTFCELVKIQVESWGMEAYIAHNGEQALKMLLQSEKANVSFDLVSIDLYMPLMDGLELGKQMNEHSSLRSIPRVLLTSVANPPTRTQLLDSSITLAIEKPAAANGLYDPFVKALNHDFDSSFLGYSEEKPQEKGETLRLLLVEDDEVNQMVIKSILQKMGHRVELLHNGLEVLEKVQADDRSFDMILMDCDMPVMNGYEATRRIRQWERKQQMLPVVIIALTAHMLDEQRDVCLSAGMDNCIEKPLNARKLRDLIASYMF